MDTRLDNRGTFYKLINTIQQNSASPSASMVVDQKLNGESQEKNYGHCH